MASTTRTTASKPAAKKATSPRKSAPKYTAERKGQHIHVFNAEGARVALLHRRDVERLGEAEHGKTLRKYVEIVLDGRVRSWAPLDTKTHPAVFAAAAKVVTAEAKAKAAAK